jgi:hypothetical protein
MGPFMSVCLSRFSYEPGNPHDPGSFEHIVATVGIEVIVGAHCYNSGNSHCWLTKVTSDHITATVTLDIIFPLLLRTFE